jgi:formate hydrogenlyase subunit 4
MQKNDPGEPGQGQNDAQPGFQSKLGAMRSWMIQWRGSRQLVLVIVAIALLLDNMLLTVVGKFLHNHTKEQKLLNQTYTHN